jgi:hypothetical protein
MPKHQAPRSLRSHSDSHTKPQLATSIDPQIHSDDNSPVSQSAWSTRWTKRHGHRWRHMRQPLICLPEQKTFVTGRSWTLSIRHHRHRTVLPRATRLIPLPQETYGQKYYQAPCQVKRVQSATARVHDQFKHKTVHPQLGASQNRDQWASGSRVHSGTCSRKNLWTRTGSNEFLTGTGLRNLDNLAQQRQPRS